MSGQLNGVQTKIKEHHPTAVYIHCISHRLNLVVVDVCTSIKEARNVFNTLEAVYVHFSKPTNNIKLCEVQTKLGLKKGSIMRVCDTRWVCRFKNCKAIIENYVAIVDTLQIEIEDQSDKNVPQAIGILTSIGRSEFIVLVFILHEVLAIINVLSNQLQNTNTTLGKSVNIINGVISTFKSLRSDESFKIKFKKKISFTQLRHKECDVCESQNSRTFQRPNAGHTLMSADSFHRQVEQSLKHQKKTYNFDDFIKAVGSANKSRDVKIMNNFGFYLWINYKSQQKIGKSTNHMLLKDIVCIKAVKDKFILCIQFDFEEECSEVDFLKKNIMTISEMVAPQPLNGLCGNPVKKEMIF
ncbi:Hypothetical protein CINCED_3A024276 [Cinara cedri]|nr:Hypothetical protein CINCED_3A024276 [Cinara cedri]